jgi:hypothetical protein
VSSIFSTPELAIGIAVGGAAGAAFEPKLEVPKQTAWANNPQRLPDLGLIAELVAGGKVSQANGRNMANRLGFSNGTLDSVVWLAQNRLDFPTMLRLWRRFGAFDAGADATLSGLVDETLAHERLDWDYRTWLRQLKTAELPGLGDIAMGVVRSALPAPSYVPVPAPTSGLTVPRFPQVNIDPEQLAAALGFDKDMLQLMVARSGLSLAPGLAAQAFFRQLINHNDFVLAIAEGDLRTEWAQTLLDASRQILTAGEYAELELRGFIDAPTRRTLTQQHGMSDADSNRLHDVLGRAPGVHALTTGLARGGTYPGKYANVPEPYRSAIQRSNIREEFAEIEYADRFTYPSAFVLRSLAQAGDLGGQQAVEQVLLEIGWKPSFAKQVSTAWTGGVAAGDKHVAKAETSLWSTTHKSFVAAEIDDATATTALTAAGVAAASIPAVLALWKEERSLIRKQLSPGQIKKAFTTSTINPATGAAWTQAEATAALLARGYDQNDATVLLTE